MEKVLITGASSGLGDALARAWAPHAKQLLITGRSGERLRALATDLARSSPQCKVEILEADLLDPESRGRLLARVESDAEPFDGVILNAGIATFGPFSSNRTDAIEAMLGVNVVAPTLLARAALSRVYSRDSQNPLHLVFVASHAALFRVPNFAVYASAKRYLLELAKTLIQECCNDPVLKSKVRIQVALPGGMATRFQERSGIPRMFSRLREPSEIAGIILRSKQPIILFSGMDFLLGLANQLLPFRIFDSLIARIQSRYTRASPQS